MSRPHGTDPRLPADVPLLNDLVASLTESLLNDAGLPTANSRDPANGVLDRAAVLRVLQAVGETGARRRLGQLKRADPHSRPAIALLEAAAGWNRAEVLTGLRQRAQLAVKAFGLLPLPAGEAGPAECLERYLALRKYAAESKQFGPQRQTNERAAVEAALANLAQTAGYSSARVLSQAMEVRLDRRQHADAARIVGPYRLELAGSGLDAAVRITRSGAEVRSVPDLVRRSAAYGELRGRADQSRAQHARLCRTVEDLLAEISPSAEIPAIRELPSGAAILSSLVLQDEAGVFGLLDGRDGTLLDDQGARRQARGVPRPVHPLQLARAGKLATWQGIIVGKRVVQPFKQVFREMYELTAAERQAAQASERFAGRRLAARAAARFLQARGWQIESGGLVLAYKDFAASRIRAVLDFPGATDWPKRAGELTTGPAYFEPLPGPGQDVIEEERVPLDRVPEVIFSEVLRDWDLLTAAAAAPGQAAPLSAERLARRTELVAAVLDALGQAGAGVEGAEVLVSVKRGAYRVRLEDAGIRAEPGGEPVRVPEHWGRDQAPFYLPVPPAEDPLSGEVVGRVLRLLRGDEVARERVRGWQSEE